MEHLISPDNIIRIDIESDLLSAALINGDKVQKIHLTSTLKKIRRRIAGFRLCQGEPSNPCKCKVYKLSESY